MCACLSLNCVCILRVCVFCSLCKIFLFASCSALFAVYGTASCIADEESGTDAVLVCGRSSVEFMERRQITLGHCHVRLRPCGASVRRNLMSVFGVCLPRSQIDAEKDNIAKAKLRAW